MKRFGPMFRKEFVQMRRDRLTLGIMVGVPVIQLMLFGFAIQTDVRHIPTVVLDESRTPASRDVIAAFENTGNFRIVAHVDGRGELDAWIARSDAQAGIVVPNDFPRDLVRGTSATIQVIVDASDPLSSQAALAAAAGIAQVRSLAILSAAANRPDLPLETRVRPRYNPGLRSPNYIVPGLVGVILTITLVLVTAMAIVRERERGTLEQLIVTPITKTELMLGKIAPYVGVGLVQMAVVLLLGRFVFDVPLVGNVLLLYGVAFVFVKPPGGWAGTLASSARLQASNPDPFHANEHVGISVAIEGDRIASAWGEWGDEANGVERFRAFILVDNRRMIDLVHRFGDVIERGISAGVLELSFLPRP